MKKILFVCVENSNRSQMSQAFANMLGAGRVVGFSAGSKPSGVVNPKAIAAMAELGYDLSKHHSKNLDEAKLDGPFDAVVTMGCGDACPWMPAKRFIDWQIPDPKHLEPAPFNEVRDMIKTKVAALVHELMLEDINLGAYFEKGMSYDDYRQLTAQLVQEGKTTGPDQSESMIAYTKLNEQRMHRGDKTVQLTPELKAWLERRQSPLHILAISEAWCGDAAQILPVVRHIENAGLAVTLRIVQRDDNPELMDAYLTGGKSRSIPVFIVMDADYKELFYWGARPQPAQQIVDEGKRSGEPADATKEKLHLWYAKDRGQTAQREWLAALEQIIINH